MSKTFVFGYSLLSYAIGVGTLIYLILFIADLYVPVTINTASGLAPQWAGPAAIYLNLALILIWGIQHSFMASSVFKTVWTKIVPPAIERSTYLLFVALMTAGLVLFWRPVGGGLWDLSGTPWGQILTGSYFFGWGIVLFSSFLINHFQLFGLQQAYQMVRHVQPKGDIFRTPFLYRLVRHPMMTGVLIALWSVPVLTVSRLIFNLAMTVYVLVGIYFEERTLVKELGEAYRAYQRSTPRVVPGVY
ncbi:isoprenylcysteine carboxylmethyltransferase family protein [Parvularcula marina]|uniref:methyltransferase family protein n=1 Tax=Parvularcula marina TaxID=2292771 RepID=UPI003516E5D8